MAVRIEMQNTGDPRARGEIVAIIEHVLSGRGDEVAQERLQDYNDQIEEAGCREIQSEPIADECHQSYVPPIFSLRVSDSSDIWALTAFLITGLIITRLVTQVRQEAETSGLQCEGEGNERGTERLFRGCVVALLGIQPEGGLRCQSGQLNLKLSPFAISVAIARVITKNVLIA